jgi:hypothetical protein
MFIDDDTRKRLTHIVKGTVLKGKEDHCTTARNLLCASFRTSTTVKRDFESQSRIKKEQADFLRQLAGERNWWFQNLPAKNTYLTRGGEAQVYFRVACQFTKI